MTDEATTRMDHISMLVLRLYCQVRSLVEGPGDVTSGELNKTLSLINEQLMLAESEVNAEALIEVGGGLREIRDYLNSKFADGKRGGWRGLIDDIYQDALRISSRADAALTQLDGSSMQWPNSLINTVSYNGILQEAFDLKELLVDVDSADTEWAKTIAGDILGSVQSMKRMLSNVKRYIDYMDDISGLPKDGVGEIRSNIDGLANLIFRFPATMPTDRKTIKETLIDPGNEIIKQVVALSTLIEGSTIDFSELQ